MRTTPWNLPVNSENANTIGRRKVEDWSDGAGEPGLNKTSPMMDV